MVARECKGVEVGLNTTPTTTKAPTSTNTQNEPAPRTQSPPRLDRLRLVAAAAARPLFNAYSVGPRNLSAPSTSTTAAANNSSGSGCDGGRLVELDERSAIFAPGVCDVGSAPIVCWTI